MAISGKKRRQVLNAISGAALEVLDTVAPEWKDGAPETWERHTREKFDLITEVEVKVSRAVERMLLEG